VDGSRHKRERERLAGDPADALDPHGLERFPSGHHERIDLTGLALLTAELIAYCFFGSYLTAVTEATGPLTTLPECRSVKEKPASFSDFLVE
jgi:hypothetical protein